MSSGDEDETSGKAPSEASMQAARKAGSRSVSTASESDTAGKRSGVDQKKTKAVPPVLTFVRSSARA